MTEKGTGVRHGPSKRIAHVIWEGCFKWRSRKSRNEEGRFLKKQMQDINAKIHKIQEEEEKKKRLIANKMLKLKLMPMPSCCKAM